MIIETVILKRRFHRDGSPIMNIVMKCDVCENIFERIDIKYLKKQRHCCSLKCSQQRPKTKIITLSCDQCQKTFGRFQSQKKVTNFCCRQCYYDWRSAHPETYAANTNAMHTPEVAKKISDIAKKRMSQPGYVHCWEGRHHTDETKKLISEARISNPLTGEKNGMYGRKHSVKAKDAMSDKHTQLIINGLRKPYGENNHKRGIYTSIKTGKVNNYRSSWELATMQFLDASDDVKTYSYENFRIAYSYNDNNRWYIPDLLITFSDDRQELWEIKPVEFINSKANILKTAAAIKYCEDNGISCYRIMTRKELQEYGIL